VEHNEIRDWAAEQQIEIDSHTEELLLKYAYLIYSTNKEYNLTGLKSLHDIMVNLIIGSIEPFMLINVPRGTIFADIGTGAGIPGIPLAIYYNAWKGVLIDSNNKKISFVNTVIRELKLENLESHCGRVEDLARGHMREIYDIVLSRALGDMYFAMEAGAPLLKQGGLLYIYSKIRPEDMPQPLIEHGRRLGLTLLDLVEYANCGIKETGILFIKTNSTDSKYPRNMAVIKREIKKYLFIAGKT